MEKIKMSAIGLINYNKKINEQIDSFNSLIRISREILDEFESDEVISKTFLTYSLIMGKILDKKREKDFNHSKLFYKDLNRRMSKFRHSLLKFAENQNFEIPDELKL